MIKRKHALYIVFFFAVSLSVPAYACGAITITEVMYNPAGSDTGREWIELYNGDSEAEELEAGQKGWKVNDGSNHLLATVTVVPPGGFVIVAANPEMFRAQYGGGTPVIKSAINFNNTGGTISLVDTEGVLVDSVSYSKNLGGFEDGTSLHRVGTSFAPGTPNPGGAPMPGVPKKAPAPAKVVASVQKSITPKVEPQQRTELKSSTTSNTAHTAALPKALPQQGNFLWHYVLALSALVVLGVASVWYIRSEQATQPETLPSAEEFDIE